MKRFLPLILAAMMIMAGCNSGSTADSGIKQQNGERPQMSQNGERPQRQRTENGENTERPQRRNSENSENADSTGERPQREKRQNSGEETERVGEQRVERAQKAENSGKTVSGTVQSIVGNEVVLLINGSEETATYLLPVGMAIGQKDFTSVKVGNRLTITFGTHPDDGSEIITAVEIAGNGR